MASFGHQQIEDECDPMFFRAITPLAITSMIAGSGLAHGEGRAGLATAGKASHSVGATRKASSNSAAPAAPCARGTYKDDPVCFGERDRDILPTPSAGAVQGHAPAPDGPSVKPTANINPRPASPGGVVYQSHIIYQSNGNASFKRTDRA
jgi:hypothetical protein